MTRGIVRGLLFKTAPCRALLCFVRGRFEANFSVAYHRYMTVPENTMYPLECRCERFAAS